MIYASTMLNIKMAQRYTVQLHNVTICTATMHPLLYRICKGKFHTSAVLKVLVGAAKLQLAAGNTVCSFMQYAPSLRCANSVLTQSAVPTNREQWPGERFVF